MNYHVTALPERRAYDRAFPRNDAADMRVDLRQLVRILARRRAWIVWTTALLVAGALGYGLLARPLFTATAQILVDPRDRNVVAREVTPTALPADGGIAQVESQLKVVTSDGVLLGAIRRLHLEADPEFGGEGTGWDDVLARRLSALTGDAGEDRILKALRLLKRKLAVKRTDKAFVIDVSATSEDRAKAVAIANAITESYLDDQASSRSDANERASVGLTARLGDLRRRVEEAENRVETYKADNNIVGASGRLVGEQQLTEINNQLVAARARTAESRARVEQIEKLQRSGGENAATAEAIGSPTIAALRTQYADIVRQEADLRANLGPRHPAIATVSAQLRDVRRLITAELGRIAGAARNDYDRARTNEASLDRSLAALKTESVSTGRASVRLRELEREAEASRGVYNAFLTRARETEEQRAIDTTNARVITRATTPFGKSWPPRGLLIAAALTIGLGLGTGLALTREHFDPTIMSGERFGAATGLPVLAVMSRGTRPSALSEARLVGPPPDRMPPTAPSLPDALDPSTPMERLRRALVSAPEAPAARGRVMLIAGSGPEDTTSVATRLAEAASREGRRVLLVEADPRARISATLVPRPRHGLASVLDGSVPLADAVVQGPSGLFALLPVGDAPAGPLTSEAVERHLLGAARAYDLTVVDAGGGVGAAVLRAMAHQADDVLFVAEAGVTREDAALEALGALQDDGVPVRGGILVDDRGGRPRS